MSAHLHIDHGDLKHGFAIGKAHKLAEWSFRKEQREFKKLVDKLRAKKWWREVKAEAGERYEKKKAQLRAQNKKPDRRKKLNEAQNARRLAAFIARGEKLKCAECGATWPKPRRVGPHKKYCTQTCQARAYRKRHRDERNAKQNARRRAAKEHAPA